jgi:Kef-type K+ transport system membrane component KefB
MAAVWYFRLGICRERPEPEALAVGVGMTSRGAVELVVLRVAQEAGVFAAGEGDSTIVRHLYPGLVIMALANTFIMLDALRAVLRRQGPEAPSGLRGTTRGSDTEL